MLPGTIRLVVLASLFLLPFSKSAAEGGFIAAILAWLAHKPFDREKWRPRALFAAYAALLAVILLSVTQAEASQSVTSLRGFLKWFKFAGVFFMVKDVFRENKDAEKLIWVFISSCFFLTLNGFYQMIAGIDVIKHYSVDIPGRLIRMRSSLGSPNGLAAFYLFALPLAFWAWLDQKRWNAKSALLALFLALGTTAFGLTFSRAAFFSLLAALLLFFMAKRRFHWALVVLACSAAFAFSSPMLRENFVQSMTLKNKTVKERVGFWSAGMKMIAEKPLLGSGVNTFFQNYPKYASPGDKYRGYAHNCYLQMACETGIPGLILFLIPVIFAIGAYCLNPPGAGFGFHDALFIGLAAFFVHAAFDTHFYALQLSYLFWTLWALFCARVIRLQK